MWPSSLCQSGKNLPQQEKADRSYTAIEVPEAVAQEFGLPLPPWIHLPAVPSTGPAAFAFYCSGARANSAACPSPWATSGRIPIRT
jgi:hypothetical protein